MSRPGNRGYISNGPGREWDVLGCNHCSASIELAAPIGCERPTRYRCGACDKTICRPCAKTLAETHLCSPVEKNLETVERLALQLMKEGT